LVHTVRMCRKQVDRRTWHGKARQGKARQGKTSSSTAPLREGNLFCFENILFYFCFVYGEVLEMSCFLFGGSVEDLLKTRQRGPRSRT